MTEPDAATTAKQPDPTWRNIILAILAALMAIAGVVGFLKGSLRPFPPELTTWTTWLGSVVTFLGGAKKLLDALDAETFKKNADAAYRAAEARHLDAEAALLEKQVAI